MVFRMATAKSLLRFLLLIILLPYTVILGLYFSKSLSFSTLKTSLATVTCLAIPFLIWWGKRNSGKGGSGDEGVGREREGSAWGRSESKGKNGYYYAHQSMTGGYKDGLKTEDYWMNGPRRLDADVDSKTVGADASSSGAKTRAPIYVDKIQRPAYSGGDVPMGALPAYSGVPITQYSFEDSGAMVKVYVRSLPGHENFSDAGFEKGDASVYWDDRESLVLLLKKERGETYSLYIKRLFGLVNDVQVIVKKKYLLVKITKADEKKEWTSLASKVDKKKANVKPVEVDGVEDIDDDDDYDDDDDDDFDGKGKKKKKTKFINKGDLPFGEDIDDMLDSIYDDIDVGEINI